MNPNKIETIAIIGGGTAGWLAASYLNKLLGNSVKITLINSEKIGRIGVGEATLPTMKSTMRFLGFTEKEWMPACNATYKVALKFFDWKENPGSTAHNYYYHAFNPNRELIENPFSVPFFPYIGNGYPSSFSWLDAHYKGEKSNYIDYTHIESAMCDEYLSPVDKNGTPLTNYAFHFDAARVADFLMNNCIANGVTHIDDLVVDASVVERGIKSVTTKENGEFSADFFIDCSGFRSLLLGKALAEPFISENDSLLINSAVALHASNDKEKENDKIRPYSSIVALKYGWSWNIPLFDRNGTGYVYSDHFVSKEDAERELRVLLDGSSEMYDPTFIKLNIGKHRNVWTKNCLALGLAGSFLEPLESTSIFFTEFQLGLLANFFPDKEFSPAIIKRYNKMYNEKFYEVRDFLVTHYILSNRDDSDFWKAVRNETKIPDSLQEKLEFFDYQFPSMSEWSLDVFTPKSWVSVLAGMGKIPKKAPPVFSHIDTTYYQKLYMERQEHNRKILSSLPSHTQHLIEMNKQTEVA